MTTGSANGDMTTGSANGDMTTGNANGDMTTGSANGAKYNSQGQARSASPLVKPQKKESRPERPK